MYTTINSQDIKNHLKNNDFYTNIIVEKSVTSTNTILKELAKDGADEGTILVAMSQTAGRGRLGRSFHSPSDTGIYFSILLRPHMPASDSLFLTTSAAVAVAKSIEKASGHRADIKWVNDVYINDRKVCGILTEGSINPLTGNLDYAIVGIGINVHTPKNGFPESIQQIAGSVFSESKNHSNTNNIIIAEILNHFYEYYLNFSEKSFFEEYKKRSFLIGRKIYVIENETNIPATALDIDDDCHLIVKYEDGSIKKLSSGEVSIKIS